MQKKQLSKQQRRKRKDPQSRDFQCRQCQKSYLSYAAAYTHVKNKHKHIKDLQQTIIKPQKQKLKRGRPKDKKQVVISDDTHALLICEETTLFVFESLKDVKDKLGHHIILEGNEEMNSQEFKKQYVNLQKKRKLCIDVLEMTNNNENKQKRQENQQNHDDLVQEMKIFQRFTKGVIKHFTAEIAAKFTFCVNVLLQAYDEDLGFVQSTETLQKIQQLNKLNLWLGVDEVNNIIYQYMCKWSKFVRKQNQEEENFEKN